MNSSRQSKQNGSAISSIPLVKLIIIGDSNVGKSCILQRFCDDEFTPSFIATVGMDHRSKVVTLPSGKQTKLQIWDTAGQEQYRAMTSNFYRSSMGVVVVYDVTWERSFENIPNWMKNLEEHASENIVKFLVGNKCDLEENRKVTYQQGRQMAERYGMKFFETSAKSSQNVEELFYDLASDCLAKVELKKENENAGNAGSGGGSVNLFSEASNSLNNRINSCCR